MRGIRGVLKGASAPFRYTKIRRMAEETPRYRNDVPPSPPDESTNTARYVIMTFGLLLSGFIMAQPKNDYNGTQNAILEEVYKKGEENAPKN
jgi:hypothetical protein